MLDALIFSLAAFLPTALLVAHILVHHTNRGPEIPGDRPLDEQRTVAEWAAERAKHPLGSPKRVAFTNRLRSLGVQVGD